MTLRLSDHQVSLLLRHLFGGWPQQAIAHRLGIDQSSVSLWYSRLKARAGQVGLSLAGKEFGIMNEVESLRALAVELSKEQLSVKEALEGLEIARTFTSLGVPRKQHKDLVLVCQKVKKPEFVSAALELAQAEAHTGITYQEALAQFEEMVPKLKHIKSQVAALSSQRAELEKGVAQRKAELATLDSQFTSHQKKLAGEQEKAEEALHKTMKAFQVSALEVETASKLKAELAKKGLTLEALVVMAKEFGDGG
jgi:division protein CdvB (Snf7/Vps24/ESCRT-III family)